MKPWLEVDKLCVEVRGRRIFDGLTFGVEAGRILAICGRTGIGKTTLLHVLAGLKRPESGDVRLLGRIIDRPGHDRPLVFQDHNLFPWLNVEQNVGFGPRCLALPKAEQQRRVRKALERVGLAERAKSRPHELSGGMRQRIGIARALAVEPQCLLMDEPFNSLDPSTAAVIRRELVTLVREARLRAVVVTHSAEDVRAVADEVIVLRGTCDRTISPISVSAFDSDVETREFLVSTIHG